MRARTPSVGGERGAVLLMFAVWLPVLAVMLTFVVDVGNWFVHKRHLQIQADAAALAGAQDFGACPDRGPIDATVAAYGGATYNAQIGSTPPGRVFRLTNSKTFHDQPGSPDDTTEGSPCTAGMIDVKLTEVDLPWFVPSFFSALPAKVKYINAQARVSVNQVDTSLGALPVGVPDPNPKAARATFINEATGAVLGSTALVKTGTSNGLAVWDNAGVPVAVPLGTAAGSISVVIALGGLSSTTCGQPLVACYDAVEDPVAPATLPTKGIVHIRNWSAAGNGAPPSDPILRGVALVPGSCVDPYFSSAASSCTYGVRARADFGPGDPLGVNIKAKLTATVGGTTATLTYSAATGLWSSPTTAFTLAPGSGSAATNVMSMDWAENAGTLTSQGSPSGNNCGTSGGNKCKGTFAAVQRAFSATEPRSGPIKVATVTEGGLSANSLERCSAVQTSCTHNLVVSIGVKGSLGNASSVSDPVVAMRVAGGSQNQSLDCDPALLTLKAELATGCQPTYSRNLGTTDCPGSEDTLWATAQPWTCVALQTGGAVNQVPAGLNLRILGNDKANTCPGVGAPGHNNWSQFPALAPTDPRIIEVFLAPFGSFDGNGSTTVPVTDFATFYVTGWTGQGGGFNNPCQGNGDDPVPNDDPGVIVGHFIKYIQAPGTGSGTTPCDPAAFGSCVAVMTR
jgi:hypothetical protein